MTRTESALSGMGVGVGDYDGDGWLDLVRTNFSDQVTTLYRNNGDGTFHEASLEAGLGINRKYLGFGAGFFDFDNDGWKDIFLANGHVYSQIAGRGLYLSYKEPRLLYQNLRNGRFKDVSASSGPGIQAAAVNRGCAFGDLDNDGDIDIVVNNLDGAPSVLRNDGGNRNNWLLIKCIGTRSNRSAIGTRVRVRRRRSRSNRRGNERIELLLAKRSATSFWPRSGSSGRSCGGPLAVGSKRNRSRL